MLENVRTHLQGAKEETVRMNDLKKLIREVPDYPKPGILFYDITTLLKDKQGFHMLVDRLCDHYQGRTIDVVAGIEARDPGSGRRATTRVARLMWWQGLRRAASFLLPPW